MLSQHVETSLKVHAASCTLCHLSERNFYFTSKVILFFTFQSSSSSSSSTFRYLSPENSAISSLVNPFTLQMFAAFFVVEQNCEMKFETIFIIIYLIYRVIFAIWLKYAPFFCWTFRHDRYCCSPLPWRWREPKQNVCRHIILSHIIQFERKEKRKQVMKKKWIYTFFKRHNLTTECGTHWS